MTQKINLSFMHVISGVLFLVMIFFQMTGMQAAFGLMAAAVIIFELGLLAMERAEDLQRQNHKGRAGPLPGGGSYGHSLYDFSVEDRKSAQENRT